MDSVVSSAVHLTLYSVTFWRSYMQGQNQHEQLAWKAALTNRVIDNWRGKRGTHGEPGVDFHRFGLDLLL